ncbi:MAG: ribonuclease HII [Saprospiraceae bacterium]|nr:ribonuclease HII [Saprospiraceae bacterium]
MALLFNHSGISLEAGCDEAGRGCLAGPVFAAVVIFPENFYHSDLNDSKKLSAIQRYKLREVIESSSLAFAVAKMDAGEIDQYNILWASIRTMHKAIDQLSLRPQHIIVDGNKFLPYPQVSHDCIIGGDGLYASIAAASILAKTYRDDFMQNIHQKYPHYQWERNKGYPTKDHRKAIIEFGPCIYHRKSFRLYPPDEQLALF